MFGRRKKTKSMIIAVGYNVRVIAIWNICWPMAVQRSRLELTNQKSGTKNTEDWSEFAANTHKVCSRLLHVPEA